MEISNNAEDSRWNSYESDNPNNPPGVMDSFWALRKPCVLGLVPEYRGSSTELAFLNSWILYHCDILLLTLWPLLRNTSGQTTCHHVSLTPSGRTVMIS